MTDLKRLIAAIDDVLEFGLQTPCGGRRLKKNCTGIYDPSHSYCTDCSDWKAPVREDGYVSQCYYTAKARRVLRKARSLLKAQKAELHSASRSTHKPKGPTHA